METKRLTTNRIQLPTSETLINENTRPWLAVLSVFYFLIVSIWGFSTQNQFGIVFNFSFNNMVILTLTILYFISISQYFLIRDNAFWYYTLYLVFNISYLHYAVFMSENVLKQLPPISHVLAGAVLMSTFFLYTMFATHFLNLKTDYPIFEKKVRKCSRIYWVCILTQLSLPLFIDGSSQRVMASTVLYVLCILAGIYTIGNAALILRGRLGRIFMMGTYCYFLGSIAGFLFSPIVFGNPWTNLLMNNRTFFPQIGILIEVIFFSSGLAYRMRLIEVQKHRIEQELLQQRVKELETEKALLQQRERISHDLHDDVGATLNSISLFSEVAIQQIERSSPQAVPVLNRIGEASRHVIDTLNDIIWVVNPRNDRFENIILRMRLFSADLLMPKNVDIDFEADAQLNHINLSVEQRKHFFLIFKEAINNVFKYANCTALKIRITTDETVICMTIMDNGKGFDLAQPKNGNGLKNIQKRAEILRGALSMTSACQKGTSLKLCFPINETDEILEELPIWGVPKPKKADRFASEVLNT